MNRPDQLEFYLGDRIEAYAESSIVPTVGSFISIRKTTYKVIKVTYAMDNADEPRVKNMRACIDLEKV